MTTKEAIQAVLKFKSLVINLINGHGDRTAINQNISIIKSKSPLARMAVPI